MKKKVLFTAVVVLLVVAFSISAFMVGNYLIEGKTWESVEEGNNEKPMEDVLPEEEEFLEGQ